MITVTPSRNRAYTDHAWATTHATFAEPGYRSLRAINQIHAAPGAASGTHRHQDAEILTWVMHGAWEHNDNLNNGTVIFPGDLQRTTAGTGIAHSECNASDTEPVDILQILIQPERHGLVPGYEQRMFVPEESIGTLLLLASRDGREHAVTVHQDIDLYLSTLEPGTMVRHALRSGRGAWLHVIRGTVRIGDTELEAGDGAGIDDEPELLLEGIATAEVLLFDMA